MMNEVNPQARKPLIGEFGDRKPGILARKECAGIVPGGVITGGVVKCGKIVGQNSGSASEVLARVIRFEGRKTAHHGNSRHRVQDRDQAHQGESNAQQRSCAQFHFFNESFCPVCLGYDGHIR